MATFAIGDIHGCLTALKAIFNENWIQEGDLVIFLGDYIDRGEDSKGVIDWLIENRSYYHFEFIKGNHEIMMRDAKDKPEIVKFWLQHGGSETLNSYNVGDELEWINKIPESHWAFLKACKPYFKLGNTVFVHAGLEKGKNLENQDEKHLFWKKYNEPIEYEEGVRVICGHTSQKDGKIADFGHTVCIDTYCYGGQWLTCLNVGDNSYLKSNNQGEVEYG